MFLVGVAVKQRQKRYGYSIDESLEELARLADTAGLEVGSTLAVWPQYLYIFGWSGLS